MYDKVEPDSLSLEVGDDAIFTCDAQKDARWLFNSNSTLPECTKTGQSTKKEKYFLKIFSVTVENSGIYTCLGEDFDAVYFVAEAELIVTGKQKYITLTIRLKY